MRVVLDTGILVASLITSDTPPDLVCTAWRRRRFQLITSDWQLQEFRRVTRYPKLRPFLKPAEVGTMVNGLRQRAPVLEKLPTLEQSADPDDNPVLAMAMAGRADYLVTGDKRGLLALKTAGSARIVTARELVEILKP